MIRAVALVPLVVATLSACGGNTTEKAGGGSGGDGGAIPADAGGGCLYPPAGGSGSTSANCTALSETIASTIPEGKQCVALVRVSYATCAILAHAFVCTPSPTVVDEATARAIVDADTTYGDGDLLNGPTPVDDWVFRESPGDFGGVGVLSARGGMTVFGASIIWAGTGQVELPSTWDTSDLGQNCPSTSAPTLSTFDLALGDFFPDEAVNAFERVWNTALPGAIARKHEALDAIALRYAPSIGAPFYPDTAEFVVLVNFERND